jgi:hypothetical protein
MGKDELLRHFYGGFVRLHILYHAAKEPICGVEMIEELKRHGYKLSRFTPSCITLRKTATSSLKTKSFEANAGRTTRSPRRGES